MNLFLLRHGEAEHQANSDPERELTARGSEDVINVAKQFANKSLPIDRCLVSPYLRAQQTAALFISQLSVSLDIETESILIPEVRALQVLKFLDSIDAENILLISHNPLLSELFALLLNGGIQNMHIVSTSELNSISLEHFATGMGTHQFTLCTDA